MTSSGGFETPSASPAPRRRRAWLVVLAVLAAQNAALFWGHYAGTVGFPWDFQKTYHAVPFYWTTAVGAGTFPSWVPYQGVGSALAMNLQSGLFYPPLWFFPASGVTYSLHAAAILEVLHVAFGAFGMSCFARLRGLSWRYALVAGAAYQVFGGFFCNAEHVDIVRGYAWTPWLLAALSVEAGERRFGPLRALLLPAGIFAFLTGAYPGQALALLVLSSVYLGAQLFEPAAPRCLARERLRGVALRAGYLGLGVLLALVHLLPAWLHRAELLRTADAGRLPVLGLDLMHVFTAILPNEGKFLGGEVTMRSVFLTVPIVVGVFFVRGRELRAQLPALALLLSAGALIGGTGVFRLVSGLLPPLGLSRFPAADYRALVGVPLVLLGVLGLRRFLEERGRSWLEATSFLAFLAFAWVGWEKWRANPAPPVEQQLQLAAAVLCTCAVLVVGQFRSLGARLGAVALLFVVAGDGFRAHLAVTEPWRGKVLAQDFEKMRGELTAALQTPHDQRPARREIPTFDGYRRGHFVFYDYAASDHLGVVAALMSQGPLERFAKRASAPLLLAADAALEPLGSVLAQPAATELGSVTCESFAPEEVRYAVAARTPAIVVENEPAFPGWSAVRVDQGLALEPVAAAWPLRAWRVPAGEYTLAVTFRMPGLLPAAILSLAAAVVWLVLLGAAWRGRSSRATASC